MKKLYYALTTALLRPIMRAEQPHDLNERRQEYAFALEHLGGCKTVLDVGPGRSSWPHLLFVCGMTVTAIDSVDSYWGWRGGLFNRHYPITRADILNPPDLGTFDAVTCISTLEHIADWKTALENMKRLGKRVILTVPFGNEYVANIASPPMLTQVFSHQELGVPDEVFQGPRFDVGCYSIDSDTPTP